MEHALEGFRKTFKALESGRRAARHEGVSFLSIKVPQAPFDEITLRVL